MEVLGITPSFAKLRRLANTFDRVATTRRLPSRAGTALRIVRELGGIAFPLLERKLRDDDDAQSTWAYDLLRRAGGDRAARAARALAIDPGAPDSRKAVALALLVELGAPLPDIDLADPAAIADRSLRDLVGAVGSPADAARATELVVAQVTDLEEFARRVVDSAGSGAAALLDELLVRDDVPSGVRDTIVELRATLPIHRPAPRPARDHFRALHADGRRVFLALAPGEDGRVRALTVELDATGALIGGRYADELSARAADRRFVDPLRAAGFTLTRVRAVVAAGAVADGARATRAARRHLPRAYFLGRDLLGLHDEHLSGSGPKGPLARARHLANHGHADTARCELERHIVIYPADAEARAELAACLDLLGDSDGATTQLGIAARLEPDSIARHHAHALAAHSARRHGAAYLAYAELLRLDAVPGIAVPGIAVPSIALAQLPLDVAQTARAFMAHFETIAATEHPGSDPRRLARAEDLFVRACAHVDHGRSEEAIACFEAVLELVPTHYASWGNLGAAHLSLRQLDDAERCLLRALEQRPDYDVALKNLALLSR